MTITVIASYSLYERIKLEILGYCWHGQDMAEYIFCILYVSYSRYINETKNSRGTRIELVEFLMLRNSNMHRQQKGGLEGSFYCHSQGPDNLNSPQS